VPAVTENGKGGTGMTLAETIFDEVQEMPGHQQAQVLDFLEYLKSKDAKENKESEQREWSDFSLAQAVRGMEDEPELYSLEDIRGTF
jgi:hypothetical protein